MKRINREAIQRMVDARGGKAGGTNSGGGGGSLAGYATQAWVNEGFVSIEFFNRLFTAYGPGATSSDPDVVVEPNDLDSTITNIKAMFGLWTEQYLSALGLNPGGTGSATSLSMLDDVDITTPTNGQALVYNSTTLKWENQTISTVTALANLTDVLLTSPAANQFLMYDGTSAKWVNSAIKTINGQSLYGSGDISVGGGASGNYLPLSGGTLVGSLFATAGIKVVNICIECDNSGALSHYGSEINNWNDKLYIQHSSSKIVTIATGGGNVGIGTSTPSSAYKLHVIGAGYFTTGLKAADVSIENGNEINHASLLWLNYNSSNLMMCKDGKVIIGNTTSLGGLPKFTVLGASYLQKGARFTSICIECDNSMGDNTARTGEINTYDSNLYIQHNSSRNLLLCDGGGNVGIGTSPSSSYKLHVAGTIYATGEITALSDINQKNVQEYMQLGIDEVADAPVIKFTWKDQTTDNKGLHVGSIAQYWEKVLPEAVKKDKEGTLSMSYGVVALVAAISTAKKVQEHERRIADLERENERLMQYIEQLRLN